MGIKRLGTAHDIYADLWFTEIVRLDKQEEVLYMSNVYVIPQLAKELGLSFGVGL